MLAAQAVPTRERVDTGRVGGWMDWGSGGCSSQAGAVGGALAASHSLSSDHLCPDCDCDSDCEVRPQSVSRVRAHMCRPLDHKVGCTREARPSRRP